MVVRHRADGLVRAPAPQAPRRAARPAGRGASAGRRGSKPGGRGSLGGSGPRPRTRLRHPRRRPHRAWRISVGAAVAAAAAVVLVVTVGPRPEPVARQATRQQRKRPAIDPKALAALDRAEADYKDAAKVLEAEYARL